MRINHVAIAQIALSFYAAGQTVSAPWLVGYLQSMGIKTTKGHNYDPHGRGIYRAIHVAYNEMVAAGYQGHADAIANVYTKPNGNPAWA